MWFWSGTITTSAPAGGYTEGPPASLRWSSVDRSAVAIESSVRCAAEVSVLPARSRRPDSPRTTGNRPVGLHIRAFSSFLSSSDVGYEAQDSRAGTFPRPQVRAHETPDIQANSVVYVASRKKVTAPFFLAAYQCGNSTVYFQIRARPLLVF